MKLNLGAGFDHKDGFKNIDIRPEVKPDLVEDVSKLESIPDNSCEVIYASHILEHFSWRDTDRILALWVRKLKQGGLLHIKVPNLAAILFNSQNIRGSFGQFISDIYGGQEYEQNYHKTGFEVFELSERLVSLGLKIIYNDYSNLEITIECEKL